MSLGWLESTILGLVEGVTEFLPISSTGHLILTSHFLGLDNLESIKTFEIFIQLGAILAVIWLYPQRFKSLFQFKQEGFSGLKAWVCLGLTSLPAIVVGLLLHEGIKAHLFNAFWVTVALAVGGLIILAIELLIKPKGETESLNDLSYKQAFGVGVFQCFALWPGMSRSASTIFGGLFLGLNRQLAAEYSFLAAVPIIGLASLYDLKKSMHLISSSDIPMFALGFIVAFISAILAIRFFVSQLQKHTLLVYGVYRVVLAIILLTLFQGSLFQAIQ